MPPKLNVQIDASAPFDAGHATHSLVIDAQASNRGYMVYRNLKTKFELEAYLLRLPQNVWRKIVKLRCNHKLEIETGRYACIDRDLRFCGKCAMSIIGDEYHVFFECSNPNVYLQRTRFIPLYFRRNRSMFNFVKLLQSVHDIKIGCRVSSFAVNSHVHCVMPTCE